ncbi:efflux RND transporter periplasmic adaptor subunit [Vagococcus silagei]|uniref:HlyD family efflux transporter periplasmic adaptor subunit n=1 Tax=Vagococcus silagei TaxID=2508885 RepID=A0A4S3B0A0_9ENTE|nr:efflux RND transporter periplasmic adaptor subunit [Vagococcus silagei]THB60494.1 hypothetical protein ESZ54_09715 [Vagococcus silagei]
MRSDKRKKIKKNKYWFIILFLFVMLVFTFISRATKSFTVPKIATSEVSSQRLEEEFTSIGTVRKKQNTPIFSEENLRITGVNAYLGQKVEKGSPLFQVDQNLLDEQINALEKNMAIQSLRVDQANETYQQVVKDEERKVAIISGKLEKAKASGESESLSDLESQLEQAKTQKESNVLVASQALKLAESEAEVNKNAEMSRDSANRLQALQTLKNNKGIIQSPITGYVSTIKNQVGDTVTSQALMTIENETATDILTLQVDKESQKYFMNGSKGKVIGVDKANVEKLKENAQVIEVKPNVENNLKLDVVVELGESQLKYGSEASFSIEKSSKEYKYCVPSDAVHEDKGGTYVLIVEDQKGILGSEKIAKKVRIKILAKTETVVAIDENNQLIDKKIVLELNKTVSDGDQIRIMKAQEHEES